MFQTPNGGFSYWPGGTYDSEWGSNYGGHFLLEAEKKGFAIPQSLKSNWLKFQKKQAKNWNNSNSTDQPLIEVIECTDEGSISEFEILMAARSHAD